MAAFTERYGVFAERSLAIPATAGLTIIYGPNEAGKSTCLAALSDFLFGIAAMSDGTRDQLFLAFRLASLENYAASTEPLPFVADDILVHFDDERAAATLELLARFAETNQVLLFTHHKSVRDDVLGSLPRVH